jgi:DtxR family Mn-dependent transcriptional regulator
MAVKNKEISASLEDYLEAIFNLLDESEVARSKDIAEKLDVSKASVTGALRLLKKKGLVNYEPYGCVTLTKDGTRAAGEVAKRHDVLESFFVNILGIETQAAQNSACTAEHALGNVVVSRLKCFIEYVNQQGGNIAEDFKRYYESGNRKIKL